MARIKQSILSDDLHFIFNEYPKRMESLSKQSLLLGLHSDMQVNYQTKKLLAINALQKKLSERAQIIIEKLISFSQDELDIIYAYYVLNAGVGISQDLGISERTLFRKLNKFNEKYLQEA